MMKKVLTKEFHMNILTFIMLMLAFSGASLLLMGFVFSIQMLYYIGAAYLIFSFVIVRSAPKLFKIRNINETSVVTERYPER